MAIEAGHWCILRMAGRSTLPLAKSLSEAGFDVWTPALVLNHRVPRAKARIERNAPIMPTYAFARARHLLDLLELAAAPSRQHEGFSVFHYLGKIPLVADLDLEALRTAEGKAVPKQRRHTYGEGDTVRVPEGSFGGMIGTVVESDGRYTLVCFGSTRVKIATFLLRQDGVRGDEQAVRAPRHRHAAKYLGQAAHVGKPLSAKCEACNDESADRDAVEAAPRP